MPASEPQPVETPSQLKRSPRRLLLSFLGEFLAKEGRRSVKARAVIHAFSGAGINPPATRAALDRRVTQGLLEREKRGREVEYSLTERGEKLLLDAQDRVQGLAPFDPNGEGWSLVLFSLAAETQPVRHRLRSILAWEGFAPFGRGAWIAPGEVDFEALREAVESRVQSDAIVAFRAHLVDGFSMGPVVQDVWDVPAVAAAHQDFAQVWASERMEALLDESSPLALRTMLVADWLELLRADPRLPASYLPSDWPAAHSFELFWAWQARLKAPSLEELRELDGD